MENQNIIYVLTNDAFPGLVKIGKTHRSIEQRMRDLFTTGVPVPFDCFHAAKVMDANDVEKRLHRAFEKFRLNKNREFFEINPENIVEILEMVQLENVTPNSDIVATPDDVEAMRKLEKRAERFSFSMVGIAKGETLTLDKEPSLTAQVLDNNNVLFNGQQMSLSGSALEALHSLGFKWKSAQGAAHWQYQGRSLKEIREEREAE